jgi:Fur family transcriptional regulator, ferric uptake regulator
VVLTRKAFRAELNEKGWRLTPQREKILHIFQTLPQGNHLSADDLYKKLTEQREEISLSTVYRTVKIMARMGILRELELAEGHKHYEINTSSPHHHHHVVCIQCNRTIEFENDSIMEQSLQQVQRCGWQMIDCQLTIYGICKEAIEMGYPAIIDHNWRCHQPIQLTAENFEIN